MTCRSLAVTCLATAVLGSAASCRAVQTDVAPGTPTPAVVVVTATPPPAPASPLLSDSEEERTIRVYETASPAVVNIVTRVLRQTFFFGIIPEEGSGSGFLWDEEGHIVTNYHVVSGASRVTVSFDEGVGQPATIVGGDRPTDLAVLRVERVPPGVRPIEPGDSSALRVGQRALAIGNPFGQFERTLTVGVVSALDRTVETGDGQVLRGAIQTDAAINRGNSGGPLLDSAGRLIGVNTAIVSPTGTSAGIGLAIPVNTVLRVVPEIITHGRYRHPWLGVAGYTLTPALAQALNLPVEQGLLIARVYPGSPADRAGLRGAQREIILRQRRLLVGGDILVSIDNQPLAGASDLDAYLDEHTAVGQTVTLGIIREGERLSVDAQLVEEPRG